MIDAHIHLWTLDPARYPWQPTLAHVPVPQQAFPVEQYIAEADGAGVSLALIVQPSVYGWDNSYLCDAIAAYPDRFIGICMVDARGPDPVQALEGWVMRGCRGLRINTIGERSADWLLAERLTPLWDSLAAKKMPLCLQIAGPHASIVSRLAARRPGLPIIVEYMGSEVFQTERPDETSAATLAEPSNVYLKALMAPEESRRPWPHEDLFPFYRWALSAFGAERLMFGSQYPTCRTFHRYAQAMDWVNAWPFLSAAEKFCLVQGTVQRIWPDDNAISLKGAAC